MSTIEQDEERKYKIKRQKRQSYDEMVQEITRMHNKFSKVLIRRLCDSLREDRYPEIDFINVRHEEIPQIRVIRKQIKQQIRSDVPHWQRRIYVRAWPDWLKTPLDTIINRAVHEAHKISRQNVSDLNEFNILAIAARQIKDLPEEQPGDIEPTEAEEPLTPVQIFGKIMGADADLWYWLTGKRDLPAAILDVYIDLVKPTRAYRSKLMSHLPQQERTVLYNRLVWLKMLVEDSLQTSEEVEKQVSK